jgi:hypothetical protein
MNQMRKPSMIAHLGLWKMTENQTQMQFRSVTHVLNTVRLWAEIKVFFKPKFYNVWNETLLNLAGTKTNQEENQEENHGPDK